MKRIVCERPNGERMTFAENVAPWYLKQIDGVRDITHTITTTKAAGQNGERASGSTAQVRNVILTLQITENQIENRHRLQEFFQPDEDCTLYYYEGDTARRIGYRFENLTPPEFGLVRLTTISLMCGDPLFRDLDETRISLASWEGLIEFDLEIINPFEVTRRVNTLMSNIYNPTADNLGVRIRFTATGEVKNPQIIDVYKHRLFKLGTAAQPVVMHAGDVIEVTTGKNNKHATHTINGVPLNIINAIAYPPQWILLAKGDNLLRYDADEGIDALSVDIFYCAEYWGV